MDKADKTPTLRTSVCGGQARRVALSWDITLEVPMTDLLIRGIPDEVVAGVDARASRLGISRSEYIRRRLAQDVAAGQAVTANDLARFADMFGDLSDPDLMSQAWR
jgi:hypothetical protein